MEARRELLRLVGSLSFNMEVELMVRMVVRPRWRSIDRNLGISSSGDRTSSGGRTSTVAGQSLSTRGLRAGARV